jgi:ubiquinone/menaquinone biosynthesis C-methylase UbiE
VGWAFEKERWWHYLLPAAQIPRLLSVLPYSTSLSCGPLPFLVPWSYLCGGIAMQFCGGIVQHRQDRVRQHFDRIAPEIEKWRQRNRYYHMQQTAYILHLVGTNKRVLELGSGNGNLLNTLQPSYGLGIDLSPAAVSLAQKSHPHLHFMLGDAEQLNTLPEHKFDYIILSDLVGYIDDIQKCLEGLHRFCDTHTRVVISYYNFLWQPVLRLAELLHLKMPTPEQSWLSLDDLRSLLSLSDFQVVKTDRRLLIPKYIPVIGNLMNALGMLPGVNGLCLSQYVVARPTPQLSGNDCFVSIVAPCRNERGNIQPLVERLPRFGSRQEIIFVDGHSADGTAEEVERVGCLYPDREIILLIQDGQGKGDAVRKGFRAAKGDVLMILDTDMTVPPEDLVKFYRAYTRNKGEFLNGCRLVYPMEGEAMRTLNLIANKFFAIAFSWLLGERLKDTLCGTKVISRANYLRLENGRSYFGEFDPFGDFDLLFGASRLNLKIVEIPVRYRRRSYGTTQIRRFRDGWLLFRMMFFAMRKIKWIGVGHSRR